MSQRLQGLHHITVITSSAPKIFKFMTEVLGLHLIKKMSTKMIFARITFILLTIWAVPARILLSLTFMVSKRRVKETMPLTGLAYAYPMIRPLTGGKNDSINLIFVTIHKPLNLVTKY